MCGAVSQDLPEIQGNVTLPKGDTRREGGGWGEMGRKRGECGTCQHNAEAMTWQQERVRGVMRGSMHVG